MEKEPPEPENPIGIVVIGNIEPDMHDTAKEAVRRSLKRAGFKTIDVGKSVAPQVFIDKVKENNANLIAVSVNTVPAKNNVAKLDELLKAAGLKDKVGIIMGGAASCASAASRAICPKGRIETCHDLVFNRLPKVIDDLDHFLSSNEIIRARCEGWRFIG